MKTKHRTRIVFPLSVSDAILGILTTGSIILSLTELETSVRFADALFISHTLKSTDTNVAPLAARFSDQAESIISKDICRSDILNVGLNYVLSDIDQRNSLSDYEAWAKSLDRGERYIAHALKCDPADGDLWGRMAMIHRANGAGIDDLGALTDRAVFYAPSEISAIAARFSLWNKISLPMTERVRFSMDHDLRTLLFYAPPARVRDIFGGLSSAIRSSASPFFTALPRARRSQLVSLNIMVSGKPSIETP